MIDTDRCRIGDENPSLSAGAGLPTHRPRPGAFRAASDERSEEGGHALNRARGLGRWQWCQCQCQHSVCALSPTLMSVPPSVPPPPPPPSPLHTTHHLSFFLSFPSGLHDLARYQVRLDCARGGSMHTHRRLYSVRRVPAHAPAPSVLRVIVPAHAACNVAGRAAAADESPRSGGRAQPSLLNPSTVLSTVRVAPHCSWGRRRQRPRDWEF